MRSGLIALCAASCALLPLAADAQDTPGVLGRPAHSILLGVGESTNLGYWFRAGDRTDVGIEGGFSVAEEDGSDVSTIAASVGLKRYWTPTESTVAPYSILGVRVSSTDFATTENEEYGAFGGIGLDWFPVRRVSIGGHLTIRGSILRRTTPVIVGGSDDRDGWIVRTVSSGVRLQLYF